jgi:hypothetical protein
MITTAPNPLSFNSWVQNIGVMAVALIFQY